MGRRSTFVAVAAMFCMIVLLLILLWGKIGSMFLGKRNFKIPGTTVVFGYVSEEDPEEIAAIIPHNNCLSFNKRDLSHYHDYSEYRSLQVTCSETRRFNETWFSGTTCDANDKSLIVHYELDPCHKFSFLSSKYSVVCGTSEVHFSVCDQDR